MSHPNKIKAVPSDAPATEVTAGVGDDNKVSAERARRRYNKVLEAVAKGKDVPYWLIHEWSAAVGKTRDQFDDDVFELRAVLEETQDMDDINSDD